MPSDDRNIFMEKDDFGRDVLVLSKYFPDGWRLRRRLPNKTLAKQLRARCENAIAMGTWRELKKELQEGPALDYTIKEFSKIYLEEYCQVRNTRPDFKEETLEDISDIIGERKLRSFTAGDAQYFEKERAKQVSNSTVNKGLAVLSNMLTFAVRRQILPSNPMAGYGKLPVDEKVRRILEPGQVRAIVEKTLEIDYTVGAYVGILAETGLRMEEGLGIKREFFNVRRRKLTLEASKNYKTREVPLSEYAIELYSKLTVKVGNPFVFIRTSTMEELRAPRKEFEAGRAAADVAWAGLHDLRHFRATQWLKHGVDPRTVKEWLGHKDLKTTMIYLHFIESHADRKFREAEQRELAELAGASTTETVVGEK